MTENYFLFGHKDFIKENEKVKVWNVSSAIETIIIVLLYYKLFMKSKSDQTI